MAKREKDIFSPPKVTFFQLVPRFVKKLGKMTLSMRILTIGTVQGIIYI